MRPPLCFLWVAMSTTGISRRPRRTRDSLLQLSLPKNIRPSCTRPAYELFSIGGASRARTDDLIVANDALSQLSYSPTLLDSGFSYFSSGLSFPPAEGL